MEDFGGESVADYAAFTTQKVIIKRRCRSTLEMESLYPVCESVMWIEIGADVVPRGLNVRPWMNEMLGHRIDKQVVHHWWRQFVSHSFRCLCKPPPANQSANERRAWIRSVPLPRRHGPILDISTWDCVIATAWLQMRSGFVTLEKHTVSVQDAGCEWYHAMHKFPRMPIMQYIQLQSHNPKRKELQSSIARGYGIQSNFWWVHSIYFDQEKVWRCRKKQLFGLKVRSLPSNTFLYRRLCQSTIILILENEYPVLQEREIPKPTGQDALIKITSLGLNPVDCTFPNLEKGD